MIAEDAKLLSGCGASQRREAHHLRRRQYRLFERHDYFSPTMGVAGSD
jgi:hypothetical protein